MRGRENRSVSRDGADGDIPSGEGCHPRVLVAPRRGRNPPEIPLEADTDEVRLGPSADNSYNVSFARVLLHHIIVRRHIDAHSNDIMTQMCSTPDTPLPSPSGYLRMLGLPAERKLLSAYWDSAIYIPF